MPQDFSALLLPVAFIAVFYFLVLRPQRKRQQEHTALVRGVGLGDAVVTIGGIHGVVVGLDDDTMDLEVFDDTVIRFQRSSLAKVVSDPVEVDQSTDAIGDTGDPA